MKTNEWVKGLSRRITQKRLNIEKQENVNKSLQLKILIKRILTFSIMTYSSFHILNKM